MRGRNSQVARATQEASKRSGAPLDCRAAGLASQEGRETLARGVGVKLDAILDWEIREGGRALELTDSRFASTREWAYGLIWATTRSADELRKVVTGKPGFAEVEGLFDAEDLERALHARRRQREIDYLRRTRPAEQRAVGGDARAEANEQELLSHEQEPQEDRGRGPGRPRRAQVRVEALDAAPSPGGHPLAERLVDLQAPEPDVEAIQDVLRAQVAELIQRLPARQRDVLGARMVGQSYAQIAAEQATTVDSARQAYSIALRELRRGLGVEA